MASPSSNVNVGSTPRRDSRPAMGRSNSRRSSSRSGADGHPKKRVKTGCLTCRRRRIKCGEERPTCSNCARSNRPCELAPQTAGRPAEEEEQPDVQPPLAPASSSYSFESAPIHSPYAPPGNSDHWRSSYATADAPQPLSSEAGPFESYGLYESQRLQDHHHHAHSHIHHEQRHQQEYQEVPLSSYAPPQAHIGYWPVSSYPISYSIRAAPEGNPESESGVPWPHPVEPYQPFAASSSGIAPGASRNSSLGNASPHSASHDHFNAAGATQFPYRNPAKGVEEGAHHLPHTGPAGGAFEYAKPALESRGLSYSQPAPRRTDSAQAGWLEAGTHQKG